MAFDTMNIKFLKGISDTRAECFARLGIHTLKDLISYMPRGYEDRSKITNISDITEGLHTSVCGLILKSDFRRIKKGFTVLNLKIEDETGQMTVTFYNSDYLRSKFSRGDVFYFYGVASRGYYGLEFINPVYTKKEDESDTTEVSQADAGFLRIEPIYPLTKGLSQNLMRKFVREALRTALPVKDIYPKDIFVKLLSSFPDGYEFTELSDAYECLHFPASLEDAERARKTLAFRELIETELMLAIAKNSYAETRKGLAMARVQDVDDFISTLPFPLTGAQLRVIDEILKDMARDVPMNRLVMGDVGSGKTIIAICAMLQCVRSGYQAGFMAPTEILAEQHFANVSRYLKPFGINVVLLTGSLPKQVRQEVLSAISDGSADVIIGTHALIQSQVKWKRPGLVITDEQHRFGVRQRAVLSELPTNPHVLVMTATPIPRTLGLVVYGDMDISKIDELPKGRKPIDTLIEGGSRRERIYAWIRKEIENGHQVYIVHSLIDESEQSEEIGEDGEVIKKEDKDLVPAIKNFETLSQTAFQGITCALLHGRMKPSEKDDVMRRFVSGEVKILFTTTVIEVGVDVPNATIMLIENAERFGLAQLHQLRGRVGRGADQSYCILLPKANIYPDPSPDDIISMRMNTMKSTVDGGVIAEKDMEIRGPGDFFGTGQHGLPEMRSANLYLDTELIEPAREAARYILANNSDPACLSLISSVREAMPTVIQL